MKPDLFSGPEPAPLPPIYQHDTLAAARGQVFADERFRAKTTPNPCPCCGKRVKLDVRRFHSTYALLLLAIARGASDAKGGWVMLRDVAPKWMVRNDEASRLKFWGLTEVMRGETGARHSGVFRLSADGERFLLGQTRVPKWVGVYDNRLWWVSDDTVSLRECLAADGFNLTELLRAEAAPVADWERPTRRLHEPVGTGSYLLMVPEAAQEVSQ